MQSNYPSPRVGWYAVFILFLAYILSIVDRQILSLFLVPIQDSLGVSDTQMGILHGFTFAIFYALMGLPISRLIDAGNRRLVIMVGIFIWSLATMACGLATEYWHLLLARIFVGIGEATLLPGSVSLIADYFSPKRRGSAMGFFAAGAGFGNGISMLAGALIIGMIGAAVYSLPLVGELESWQIVFMLVGLPGMLMSFLVLSMREPGRRELTNKKGLPISEVYQFIVANKRVYTSILIGTSVFFIAYLAHLAWTPALLMRRFGLSAGEAGLIFGLVLFIFGPLGSACGGWVSDKLIEKGYQDAKLRMNLCAAIGLGVFGTIYPLMTNLNALIALLVPCVFFSTIALATAPSCVQDVTPGPMRGQLTALYTGLLNLIGFGLGPLLVALLTDNVFRDPMRVHFSISIIVLIGAVLASFLYLAGFAEYRRTIELRQGS